MAASKLGLPPPLYYYTCEIDERRWGGWCEDCRDLPGAYKTIPTYWMTVCMVMVNDLSCKLLEA